MVSAAGVGSGWRGQCRERLPAFCWLGSPWNALAVEELATENAGTNRGTSCVRWQEGAFPVLALLKCAVPLPWSTMVPWGSACPASQP